MTGDTLSVLYAVPVEDARGALQSFCSTPETPHEALLLFIVENGYKKVSMKMAGAPEDKCAEGG